MRVIDAHKARFNHPKMYAEHFFRCRMKVLIVGEVDEHGRNDDDWAPNLVGPEGNYDEVQVTVFGWPDYYESDTKPAYRVCVWGGDDFGLERDYLRSEATPVDLIRMVLDFPEPLTKEYLRGEGFVQA